MATMKRRLLLSVAGILQILLCGCPLSSTLPLGPSIDAPMDSRILGKWVFIEDAGDSKEAAVLSILPFNEHEYYAEAVERGRTTDRYRAYLTLIEGVPFLNVQEIREEPAKRTFMFVKVSVSEDALGLAVVEDTLAKEKPLTSDELRQLIREHIENPSLYDTPMKFRKMP
ncbi:MAG: hypothetical protein ACM3ON_00440 [Chloroflexota bacterium]